MRKVYISLLLVISSLSFAQRTITISTDNVVQTMDGFGGSDAWRMQFVGKTGRSRKRMPLPIYCLVKKWMHKEIQKELVSRSGVST